MRAELFWVSQKGGASAPCLLDLPLPFPTVDPGSQVEAPRVECRLFISLGARSACQGLS